MGKIKLGNKEINKLYTGSSEVKGIDIGNTPIIEPNYLCFEAVQATDIAFSIYGTLTTTPTLKYRKNNGNWMSYTFGTAISLAVGDKCYFKGNNSSFNESWTNRIGFSSTGNINASGNIMSLIDETCESLIIPSNGCFTYLFYNCSTLLTTPSLPATTLTETCYTGLFYNCTTITTAPNLSATTLADSCYYGMFRNCTSLVFIPELPATTLANNCYQNMFYGCTSLIQAPKISATTLAEQCCAAMFFNCTSLTTAYSIPATTLVENCYASMFNGCTSLTSAPELPATTLADSCYGTMFYDCTSLTSAPELPANVLADWCYLGMFGNCTSLATTPELHATTLAEYCYENMFSGCTSLQVSDAQTAEASHEWKIPATGTFTNTTTYNQSYMFGNCLGTRSSDDMSGAFGESHTYYTQNEPI